MAKRYKLSEVEDISLYDLSKMTSYQLKSVLAPIRDAVHKRVSRIHQAKLESPAISALTKSGGALSARGKDKEELIQEIQRGQAFLGYATSKIGTYTEKPGAREYTEQRKQFTGDGFYDNTDMSGRKKIKTPEYTDLTDRNKGRFWSVLHKIKQNGIQLRPEEYNEENQLIRTALKSKRPDEQFLKIIPAEAVSYVRNNSILEADAEYNAGKLRKKNLDNYWTDKITSMFSSYMKWQTDNPDKL